MFANDELVERIETHRLFIEETQTDGYFEHWWDLTHPIHKLRTNGDRFILFTTGKQNNE